MKVVIELSKEDMESYKNAMRRGFGNSAMRKIINGTPLPKGHGRLIDVDKMIDDFKESKVISLAERFRISNIVHHQQTIIEADKE